MIYHSIVFEFSSYLLWCYQTVFVLHTYETQWSTKAWVAWRWFSPKSIGQTRPGTTSVVNTVSVFVCHVIGISMVATALRVDFGSAAVTEIGSSRGQYLRLGRLEAIKSACTLLTRDTEQQLSNGKGKRWPADVTEVHRMLCWCNWASGFAEGAGMVMAGNPNKGVDNDGWSEATEVEVQAWFSDPQDLKRNISLDTGIHISPIE